MLFAWWTLALSWVDSLPTAVLLSSNSTDKTIVAAVGTYSAVGEAFGFPLYKHDARSSEAVRYLYHSESRGTWSVTDSEANVAKKKETIVSMEASYSPIDLAYQHLVYGTFGFRGTWKVDPTFSVTDMTPSTICPAVPVDGYLEKTFQVA